MKKITGIFCLLIGLVLLSGCGAKKELVTSCALNSKNTSQGYDLKTEYKIHSLDDEVNKVVTEEIVISDNQEILDYFKTYLTESYESINKVYGGYENKVTIEGDTLTSKTTIDYKKMDLKQYVEDNTVMKSYVNSNNMLTLAGTKKLYESMGAECK